MFEIQVGNLLIRPEVNPSILDTAAWDCSALIELAAGYSPQEWKDIVRNSISRQRPVVEKKGLRLYTGSAAEYGTQLYVLVAFPDNQHAFFVFSSKPEIYPIGEPCKLFEQKNICMALIGADIESVKKYVSIVDTTRGPIALGFTPRLGIGTRMSTSVWDAAFSAMQKSNHPTNVIQNSLRELRLFSDIQKGRSPKPIHLYSFGEIREGHTGSTFEGLWLQGVLHALKQQQAVPYGADADHIKIDDLQAGMERTKAVIDSARYYSFYTIDISNMINYSFLMPDTVIDDSVLTYPDSIGEELIHTLETLHLSEVSFKGKTFSIDPVLLKRLCGKYWDALEAFEEADRYIQNLKRDEKYDLELSIDESPSGLSIQDILTTPEEALFLLREFERRAIPVTHLAPNFGVEKGVDYRMPGGYSVLAELVEILYFMCRKWGIMLDIHSGDDLSAATRKVFCQATEGNLHFKISPALQEMFAETLWELFPELFGEWWVETMQEVRKQAKDGAGRARELLQYFFTTEQRVDPANSFFHNYMFVPLGEHGSNKNLILRELLYSLPPEFYVAYTEKMQNLFIQLYHELFKKEEKNVEY